MAEIEIECTCADCETDFDDSDDCLNCSVCEEDICENCQSDHAIKHCFENCDAERKRGKA